MRRGPLAPAAPSPPAPPPTANASISKTLMPQSLLAAAAGTRRPRTITAQAEAVALHPPPPPPKHGSDQVVVGIAAAADDDLEDWSGDFVEHTPRSRRASLVSDGTGAWDDALAGGSDRGSGAANVAATAAGVRGLPRATSLLHRAPMGRRPWQRQRSFESVEAAEKGESRMSRGSRLRRSTNDLASTSEEPRADVVTGLAPLTPSSLSSDVPVACSRQSDPEPGAEVHDEQRRDDKGRRSAGSHSHRIEAMTPEDDSAAPPEHAPPAIDDEDDEDDEDWDVEFGFTDPPEEDRDEPKLSGPGGGGGLIDPNRRRSDNFNIFLRGFHDMMAGEDLLDDDDDLGRSKRSRNSLEEQLFQRRRSEYLAAPSIDGSVDGALRSSLTSLSGTTEYTLVDKYRLVDVASSSAYAVRIERYPKTCVTFSNLEQSTSVFSLITDNKLEQWLQNIVRSKCRIVSQYMAQLQADTPNPRQQKNHQFRTLVSVPFGKSFVDKCFQQICVYRYQGDEKSNRELIRVFFEKLATAGIVDEHWASKIAPSDREDIAGVVMEILQEAARLYGPVPSCGMLTTSVVSASNSSSSSGSSNGNSKAAAFWMRQFQTILTICVEAFPDSRHFIALIELRFVCHHLVGLANGDLSYSWQVCHQYEAVFSAEPIAGHSAPIIANEILQHYGALIACLKSQSVSKEDNVHYDHNLLKSEPQVFRSCVPKDPICLLVLALCDVQALYDSKSALSECTIPELIELFEFDDEDSSYHEHQGHTEGVPFVGEHATIQSVTLELLRPTFSARRYELEHSLYQKISWSEYPLIKSRCAFVLGTMYSTASSTVGANAGGSLRIAEALGYESLRILEFVTERRLAECEGLLGEQHTNGLTSVFANDGILSELGREVLESIGNVLVKNQKYRYGILCLEAATLVYSLLHQGHDHERIERVMCTLTTQADDVSRALPLHEKVAANALRHGNVNEYVFLTQALINLWIREGKFSRAEEYLLSAFHFLRDQTSLLPPFFLSSLAGGYPSSEVASSVSRSGTVLTTSSSGSSSMSGSFLFAGRGNTSEMDLWLNHDISLHLLLRDIYRASGRYVEAMRVLEYLLNYSVRLPRGKRTSLRMQLAEDALQLRVVETARFTFHLLDQEANFFCDRLLQSTVGGGLGSSSGGFGSSSGGGGSSSGGGGRSKGGMGSEARFCFDMVLSMRYMLGRTQLYLRLGELHHAYAWLSLAHIKNERENVRNQAKLHVLDGRILFELLHRQQQHRLFPDRELPTGESTVTSVEDVLQSFSSSLYALTKSERSTLRDRMSKFCGNVENAEKTLEMGVQSYWAAFDLYQTLDDGYHQLKALLGVIQFHLDPIERAFFVLGSSSNDDALVQLLGLCVVSRRSLLLMSPAVVDEDSLGECQEDDEEDSAIERVRQTLQEAQRLLRRALILAEQIAEPICYFRTLVYCSQAWTWLEKLALYKSERQVKEGAAFWDEAVKLLRAVFLRRVAFEHGQQTHSDGHSAPKPNRGFGSTFSMIPILNFREGFIDRLECATLQLITVACQLQHFDRVPEYVEDLLLVHMDELLSAQMCLSTVSHQLRSFRSQLQQSTPHHIPLNSVPGPTTPSGPRSAGDVTPRTSFTSNSGPGVLSSNGSSGTLIGASGTKRKGHKKNQSMSSISEILASSGGGQTGSSFHDLSLSFVSTGGRGTFLASSGTPRTGLASLSDRLTPTSRRMSSIQGTSDGLTIKHIVKSPSQVDIVTRTRGRSRSAPQPFSPTNQGSAPSDSKQNYDLSPVNEAATLSSRLVDLKDVRSWGTIGEEDANGESTSSSGIGLYDFDDVQSERLWWIFNSWGESKSCYINGKTEISSFRHQNLKTLRLLLDTFDPQQVAVLHSPEKTNAGGIAGFDVSCMNSHAIIQNHGLVLSVGYDSPRLGTSRHHSRLEFKVFKVRPSITRDWRHELPRPDWYLRQASFDAELREGPLVRTLRLLGVKILLKLVGALLLENPVVVVGASLPQVKEVTLALLKLLQPFCWQHTFLPFLPVSSWHFLADAMQNYTQAQLSGRPRSRVSLSLSSGDWRWGSPRSTPSSGSTRSNANASEAGDDEPPFVVGVTFDTWEACLQQLKLASVDERSISGFVNVLNLNDPGSFVAAKSNSNAVSFPRKWRKQLLERFEKAVRQRRKLQEKIGRRADRQLSISSSHSILSAQSPASAYAPSLHSYNEKTSTSAVAASEAVGAGSDHRNAYDSACAAAFVSALQEVYDRLHSLTVERAKKAKGKKHSKRQEIKSWFSSSHDHDAFVDQFLESAMFVHYGRESPPVPLGAPPGSGSLSRSSSIASVRGGVHAATALSRPLSSASLTRSFGSISSTSSFGGHSAAHHQL